ncbi:MAG: rhodanese-like domain-containing protein [Myxococcota bacterium]|jgi:phage shock protein E|nr:rhodanese-like domain-containing protein [Myxococcota bacterium]
MRIFICFFLTLGAGCSNGAENRFKANQKKVTAGAPKEEPKKIVKEEVDYHDLVAEGAILVDVRTPVEFARGSVRGSKNVPYEALLQKLEAFGDKGQTIILFCESGRRAELARTILEQQGWTDVHNMGSHRDW